MEDYLDTFLQNFHGHNMLDVSACVVHKMSVQEKMALNEKEEKQFSVVCIFLMQHRMFPLEILSAGKIYSFGQAQTLEVSLFAQITIYCTILYFIYIIFEWIRRFGNN